MEMRGRRRRIRNDGGSLPGSQVSSEHSYRGSTSTSTLHHHQHKLFRAEKKKKEEEKEEELNEDGLLSNPSLSPSFAPRRQEIRRSCHR